MKDHPDHHFAKTLPAILRKNVKIGYRGPNLTHRSTNHHSALVAPEILSSDLQKQLHHDSLVKIDLTTEASFVCSPLGLVPKHNGRWRRTHNLSFPPGNSVNDGIPQEWGSLEYTTFDKVWLDRLRGTRVVLYCDNDACVHSLSKLSIRGLAMGPLRQIATTIAEYDILLCPTWIPTHANHLADDLSRFRFRKIANMHPQLRHLTTPPPPQAGTHMNHGTIRPRCHERPPDFSSGALQPKPAAVIIRQSNPTECIVH